MRVFHAALFPCCDALIHFTRNGLECALNVVFSARAAAKSRLIRNPNMGAFFRRGIENAEQFTLFLAAR